MNSVTRSSRQKLLGKWFKRRDKATSRRSVSSKFHRFESLENRLMLHAGEDHGFNGPHETDPTYDLNNFTIQADLSIYVNGVKTAIPTWGGAVGGDEIFTTNTSGRVTIHPLTPRTSYVNLGEVFTKWKEAPQNGNPNAILNDSNLLNNLEDGTHTVHMFVNGVKTEVYQNYQIHNGDEIVLAYSANPILTVNTTLGSVPLELFADKTPITVNNFLNYVNDGDYTNTFFHRYISDFVLQGGGFKTTTTSFADPSVVNNFTPISSDAQIQNEFDNFAKSSGTEGAITTGNSVISLGTNVDLSGIVAGDRVRLAGRTDGIGGSNMFDILTVNDAANTVTVQTNPAGPTSSNLVWTIFPRVNVTGTLAMAKLGGNPNSATNQFFINLTNNDANLDLQNGGFTVFGQILDQSILDDIAGLNDLSLFSASLTGAQEVPPVTTSASGSATLALNNNNNQFDLKLNVQGLSQNSITASHLHPGALGAEGASFFDLGEGSQYTVAGNQVQRTIDNGAFPTSNLNSLFSSQAYANVHTTANPDGEIRGQLTAIQGGLYSDLPTTSTDELIVIQSINGEGTVRGTIFTDADNDSLRDQNETGNQGFTVYADANNNGVFDAGEDSATSDVSGSYALALPSGQHKVRLVPTNGFAKTLPTDAYDVTVQIGREVTGRDFGVIQVPALFGLDLLPATDSGASSTDNLTNFNNSTAAQALQFAVQGVAEGALVRIFADGVVIGQATVPAGTNGTLSITTNGTAALTNGTRSMIATQELRGVQSTPTASLGVTIDTAVQPFTSTPPTTANVGVPLNHNVENPEEGQPSFVYALLNPPAGAVVNATTGTIAWTPTAAQTGTQQFQVSATDAAGNVLTQSFSVAVGKDPVLRFNLQATDLNGTPISQINIGSTFQLRATVEDLRPTASRTGVFSAYEDIVFDGSLATATGITHSTVYGQGAAGTITAGLLDEVGSFAASIQPLGPNPQLLYTVTLTANRSGTLTFTGNQPDVSPQHDLGVYGQDGRVPFDEVNYGLASLAILNPDFQANNDVFNFDEDTSNDPLNVLVNDHVGAGTTLTIVSTGTTSKGGTVTIAADQKSLLYSPPANFFGEDSFTYTVSDGSDQAVATVAVQVVDVNDPPPAVNDLLDGAQAVPEDSTGVTLDLLLNERAATNVDQGAPNEVLRISAVGQPISGGTVTIGSQGAFVTYTPAPNFSGIETFTYTITDRSGNNGLTAVATATVTVTPQNDSPLAVADAVNAEEDSQDNVFNVLANDSIGGDAGESLTITSVGAGSRGGQVTIVQNGTRVNYTPAANIFGQETFTYTISDGNGGSATGLVTVVLAAKNDAPDAKDDVLTVAKNSTLNIADVLLNDLSTPDDPEAFVITAVTQGNQGGTVEIVESGAKIQYRPANNYLGSETFTYTMRDPGGLTDTATVTVTVRDFVPSSLAGATYLDADNDGVLDSGEQPVANVTITLTGTDSFGSPLNRTTTSDATGAYKFDNLPPGTYQVKETQPTGQVGGLPLTDGKDTIGSQGGTVSANDEFTITLAENVTGTGNNFGELTGFKITGRVTQNEGSSALGEESLAFNAVEVSLFSADAQDKPTGSVLKSATLKADGSFSFDGVAAGKYVLQSETLKFLTSMGTAQVVTVTANDSVNDVAAHGFRQTQFISYRDFLNSTPRTGIFAAVTPGANGHQWSALDSNWSSFSEAKVELSADASRVRIEVTRPTGEKLFDEIPATDHRVMFIANDGGDRLLRLAGSTSDYNLRPVTSTSASGEGESAPAIQAIDAVMADDAQNAFESEDLLQGLQNPTSNDSLSVDAVDSVLATDTLLSPN